MNCKNCGKKLSPDEESNNVCFDCLYLNSKDKGSNEKECKYCKELLPITYFYKDKTKKDGYKPMCKLCYQIYYKRRKERDRIKSSIDNESFTQRKYLNWLPEENHYYIYRDESEQSDKDVEIIKVTSIKEGKNDFIVINFEPIKTKNPSVTQIVIRKRNLWFPWKIKEISKYYAEKHTKKQET